MYILIRLRESQAMLRVRRTDWRQFLRLCDAVDIVWKLLQVPSTTRLFLAHHPGTGQCQEK